MKEKSDKSKSAWNSRKYVMTVTYFFHLQSEVPKVKSRQLFYKKIPYRDVFWEDDRTQQKVVSKTCCLHSAVKKPLKKPVLAFKKMV